MFATLLSIIGILLTIFFVVGTHEYAHFLTARFFKVKVLQFSIGFGKVLFRWQGKSGTQYVISLLPLGGYVKMLDESEEKVDPKDLPHAFNRQPYYKKFLIVAAGPLTNIVCAFLLYWVIFLIGFTTIKPIIGTVSPHSIAAEAGLKPNQQIVSIDNHATKGWTSIIFRIIAHAGNEDHLLMQTENVANKKIETHVLDLSNWHMNELTPDPLSSLGILPFAPDLPLVIGVIKPDSPAALSPLKVEDKILKVNNAAVKDWESLITLILKHPSETLNFTIERKGKTLTLPVQLGYERSLLFSKSGYLGIAPLFNWPPQLLREVKFSPGAAAVHAFEEMYQFTYFNLLLMGKLITGKLSLQSLGGPITIFESAGQALNSGFLSFLGFLAFLSISIGIINFLPIPGLDGGHLLIYFIEVIIQRPVPDAVLNVLYKLGLFMILFFFIQAFVNDILRLY